MHMYVCIPLQFAILISISFYDISIYVFRVFFKYLHILVVI